MTNPLELLMPALRARLQGRSARERQRMAELQAELHADLQREREHLARARDDMRRADEALQLSEQRYVQAVRGAQDGVWEQDVAAGTVWLSPRCRHLLGLDDAHESLGADAWLALIHPGDRDAARQALDAHLRGDAERYEHQHRMQHADGRWRWVVSRGAAIRRANGRPYRVVGLDTDVTRIKRVEDMIDAIAEGTANTAGERFFQALVQHFARALCVKCAFITECHGGRPATRARTLAYWRGDAFGEDHEYELAGTPCERVLHEGTTVFQPSGLSALYPRECGRESYLGLPIFSRDGDVLGHLAFVDDAPMGDDMLVASVYRIFTARAAAEIELAQALAQLKASQPDRRPSIAAR
jgi:PAS domain S-box-containing protein